MALFQQLNKQYGLTTIIVTHDPQVAKAVDRVVTIRDGRTSSETVRRNDVRDEQKELETTYDEYVVVDGVGRLQIPPDIQEQIGLNNRVTISLTDDGNVLLKPVQTGGDGLPDTQAIFVDEPAQPKAKGLRRFLKKWKR